MANKIMHHMIHGDDTFEIVDKKLRDAFVSPEMFGAVGDGITDDTSALQTCLNNGNKRVQLKSGSVYKVTSVMQIYADTVLDLNNATIKTSYKHLFFNFDPSDVSTEYNGTGNLIIRNGNIEGGAFSFIHGKNILLDNVHFLNCLNDHWLEICACSNYIIRNCSFVGMANKSGAEYINIDPCFSSNFPWLNNAAVYDQTPNEHIVIEECYFSIGKGDYAYGNDAIGVHSGGDAVDPLPANHSDVRIVNNTFDNFITYSLRINCIDNAVVTGNIFNYSSNYAMEIGAYIPEDNLLISNNIFNRPTVDNLYVILIHNKGVTNLSFIGNSVIHNMPTELTYLYCYSFDSNTQFSVLKSDRLFIGGLTTIAPITSNIPVTKYNILEVHTGTVDTGTYETHFITAYRGRNFLDGESFKFICNDDGTPTYKTVTIGEYTVSCDAAMRGIFLSKL